MNDVENLIKKHVAFHDTSSGGFSTLKCPVCNDYKVRAGFKFEIDRVGYNCFRGKCPLKGTVWVFDEPIPKKFKQLMKKLGVKLPASVLLEDKKKKPDIDKELFEEHHYKTVELPKSFVPLKINSDKIIHKKFQNLLEKRHIDFSDKKFYVGVSAEWANKLIIPIKFKGKLIGWIGWGLDGRYLKSSDNTDKIFVNSDGGWLNVGEPLIVEGIMDALCFPDAIAVFGNTVTKKQAYMLKDLKPILIPDRKDCRFIDVSKKYTWRISYPDWGKNNKDINDGVINYGVLYVNKLIHDGIQKGGNNFKSDVLNKMWGNKNF